MSLPDLSGLCLGKPHARVAPTGANAKVVESYRGGDKEVTATYRIAVVDDAPPNNPDREYPLKYDSDYEYKATYEVMYRGISTSTGKTFGGVEVSVETVETLAQHIVDAVRTEEHLLYIYTDGIAPYGQPSSPGAADEIPTRLLGKIEPSSVRDDPGGWVAWVLRRFEFLKQYLESNIEDVKGPRFILSRQSPAPVGKITATGKRLKEGQTAGARNGMKRQSDNRDGDAGSKRPKSVDPYEYYQQRKNTSMHNDGFRNMYDDQYGSKEDPIEQEGEMEALQEMIAEKLAEIKRVENGSNPSSYRLDKLKEELAELQKMVQIIAPHGPTRSVEDVPLVDDALERARREYYSDPLPYEPPPSTYYGDDDYYE